MKKFSKKDKDAFFTAFAYSAVVFTAIIILMLGIFKSYIEIRRVGFCDQEPQAFSVTDDGKFQILDFTL